VWSRPADWCRSSEPQRRGQGEGHVLKARLREVDQALIALTEPTPGVEADQASAVATPAQPGPAPTL